MVTIMSKRNRTFVSYRNLGLSWKCIYNQKIISRQNKKEPINGKPLLANFPFTNERINILAATKAAYAGTVH